MFRELFARRGKDNTSPRHHYQVRRATCHTTDQAVIGWLIDICKGKVLLQPL